MTQTEKLLQLIQQIQKRHISYISKTGIDFNIFEIIGLTADEVRVHSAFIANLLNPRGTHHQGAKFLKLFVERVGCKNIDVENANVECEKYVGRMAEDSGGRLDILISGHPGTIIIENKIYASDQHNQLVRYHKYDEKALLLYLTLDGREPSKESKGDLTSGRDYKCISYAKDILGWLEDCRGSVKDTPIIYEALGQYIVLIRNLTNQPVNKQMSKEIIETILASQDNIEAALEIVKTWNSNETRERIRNRFWQYLEEQLIKRFGKIDIKRCCRNRGKEKLDGLEVVLSAKTDDVRFYWRVEADYNVYSGIVIKNKDEYITGDAIEKCRKSLKDKFEGWYADSDFFLYWRYPNGQKVSYRDINDLRLLLIAEDNKFVSAIVDDFLFAQDYMGCNRLI